MTKGVGNHSCVLISSLAGKWSPLLMPVLCFFIYAYFFLSQRCKGGKCLSIRTITYEMPPLITLGCHVSKLKWLIKTVVA